MRLAKLLAMCVMGVCGSAYAGVFGFSGHFTADDNHVNIYFTLVAPTTVTVQTWSYGGGVDPLSTVVSAGGFAPVISVFDSSDQLLAFDAGGSAPACGARSIDATTGLCLDALLNLSLNAGNYLLVLTQNDNLPIGPTLADGFLRDGMGNFTGPTFIGVPGAFIDPGLNARNDSYALSFVGVNGAFTIPEPSSWLLFATGLALCALGRRLR